MNLAETIESLKSELADALIELYMCDANNKHKDACIAELRELLTHCDYLVISETVEGKITLPTEAADTIMAKQM